MLVQRPRTCYLILYINAHLIPARRRSLLSQELVDDVAFRLLIRSGFQQCGYFIQVRNVRIA